MLDSLGASPLAAFAPTSLTLSSPRTDAGMTMKMTMGLTKGQMSDSLGAAPLAQFAPASLTSAPPGTRTGMETEEAVGTRKKKKRNNSGNDLGVSRTYGSTQFSMQRML